MSKLKLLLLGGIFTLFGIFNFSSAVDINLTCAGQGDCSPSPFYTFEESYDNLCFNFNIPAHGQFYNEDYSLSLTVAGGNSVCGNVPAGPVYFYHGNKSNENYVLSFTLPGEGGNEGGNEGGQIIPGGFDNFTPAVDGLHTTVKQLIPLVIYLGIGVLVLILGFIAIRWLVNWMSNGIKSKFSSKRS